ncbi:MAG: glycosyltransferase family 4 protein [Phascolarctobacterium sp.]|nr:glycosyltransferase family 4 protein [Phascolarctobacterium sp.]
MKKVCFYPIADISNEYVYLMRKAIDRAGYKLADKTTFNAMMHSDVIHLNWYEGLPLRKEKTKILKKYVAKLTKLKLLKLSGKKLIVTIHNNNTYDDDKHVLVHNIMKWLLDNADAIVIHCKESLKVIEKFGSDPSKAHFVPHPNLIGMYEDVEKFDDYVKEPDDFVVLFLGTVRPYKNVETVIRAAEKLTDKKNIKILICGRTKTAKYTNELSKIIKTDNIKTAFRFIADEELPSLVSMADALVLPYVTNSSLNSGAAFLAFSYGRTIISTDIGTAKEYADDDLIYMYEYASDEATHVQRLADTITKAYNDFVNDPASYKAKGETLKARVTVENSLREIGNQLKKIYE